MRTKLEWSQQARTELETILLGVHSWNPTAARRLRARIIAMMESVRDYPELGHEIRETGITAGYRRVVVDVYLIAYQVFPGRVRVASVWDGRRLASDAGDSNQE